MIWTQEFVKQDAASRSTAKKPRTVEEAMHTALDMFEAGDLKCLAEIDSIARAISPQGARLGAALTSSTNYVYAATEDEIAGYGEAYAKLHREKVGP